MTANTRGDPVRTAAGVVGGAAGVVGGGAGLGDSGGGVSDSTGVGLACSVSVGLAESGVGVCRYP